MLIRTIIQLFTLSLISISCIESGNRNKAMEVIENIKVEKLTDNHWQTYTDIIINAPVEEVWKVMTDWDNLSAWSTSLKSIKGDVQNKGKVIVSYLVEGKVYETSHVFIYKENNEFGWSDKMEGDFSGLTDNHRFRVERINEGQTRFIQVDDFKGVGNKKVSAEDIARVTVAFFPIYNRELKQEVER